MRLKEGSGPGTFASIGGATRFLAWMSKDSLERLVAMSKPTGNMEVVERMLGRLNEVSQRISKDVEKQAKLIDHKIKEFVDQGEKATERLVKRLETEVRSQVASLQHDVEQLANKINEMVASARKPSAVAPAKPLAMKKTVAGKPVRKPASKKPAARKTPSRRVAA